MNNRTKHVYGTDNFASTHAWQSPCLGITKLIAPLVVAGAGLWLWEQVFELPPSSSRTTQQTIGSIASVSATGSGYAFREAPNESPAHASKQSSNIHHSGPRGNTVDVDHIASDLTQQHASSQIAQDTLAELLWLIQNPSAVHGAETSAEFRRLLAQLTQQDTAALPLIRDYLLSGADTTLPKNSRLPYDTLRQALLDALHRIGGQQALAISLELLQTQISPQELLTLAGFVNRQAPDLYLFDIQHAGRQLLDRPELTGSAELGLVYQLLGELDGTSVDKLRQAPLHQQQYADVALALLPGAQGVPGLLEKIRQSDQMFAAQQDRLTLKLLAQVAPVAPAAAEMLAELAIQNRIPAKLWMEIAALAGGLERIQLITKGGKVVSRHQFSIAGGEQVIYRVRTKGPTSPEEALARLEVIEHLYVSVDDPIATQALATVLDELATRPVF